MKSPEQFETEMKTEDEVHLLDYFVVIAKNSRVIVFTPIIVMLISLSILFLFPNQYTATARILQPQQNMTLSAQLVSFLGISDSPLSGGAGQGLGNVAAGLLGLKSPGDLYVGVLTSQTIFDRIIERFDLKELYGADYIENAREELKNRADISVGKEGLINISITDKDPKRAAAIANAFLEELSTLMQDISQTEARSYLNFLEKEREKTTVNLAAAEEALRTFSEESKVLQIDSQTKGMLEYVATLKAAIDAKEVQLQVMRQQATPHNYDIIYQEIELKGLKEKLNKLEVQKEQSGSDNVFLQTSRVPALGLKYYRLLREAKYQEALFQLYSKLVELARLDTLRSAISINVVDLAIPPEKKSKPKRLTISIAMGLVTFFVMIVWAFVREGWQKLKQSEDSESLAIIGHYMDDWKRYFQPISRLFRRRK